MVGRTLLMLILLAIVPLSGCLGGDSGGDAETEPLDAAPEDAGGPAPKAGERKAAVAAGNLTPQPEPFSWDGSVGTIAGACAVVYCFFTGAGAWDNTRKVSGIVGGEVTLSWDLPTELAFGLATRCDGTCDFVASTSGTSPFALSFDDLDPDRTYTLVAWHPYRNAAGVAGTQVGSDMEFHVEGTLMAV